jgi:hypothetical protein
LDAYARAHGAAAFQAAVSAGQYTHPDGLFYGGTAPAWSALALQAVLTEDLSKVKTLVAMDFHTGLGESGAGEMIVEAAPDSPAFGRARGIWGDMAVSEAAGDSQSVPLTGTLDQGLATLVPGVELTHGVLEVGTVPLATMIRALRLANWQDHFAPGNARAAEIGRVMRDAFYTDTPEWKRAVWEKARICVTAATAKENRIRAVASFTSPSPSRMVSTREGRA